MNDQPILETDQLRLRPLASADAPAIQKAAAVREVADTMISIPHPYPDGEAERFVTHQKMENRAGRAFSFVIESGSGGVFCGLIEIRDIDREHSQGELSFWLAPDAWGRGYMSEVVGVVMNYGFETLGLNRLYAYHMLRNPATGRVLEKNGFRREGILRQRVRKWDRYEDVALWAVLKEDRV